MQSYRLLQFLKGLIFILFSFFLVLVVCEPQGFVWLPRKRWKLKFRFLECRNGFLGSTERLLFCFVFCFFVFLVFFFHIVFRICFRFLYLFSRKPNWVFALPYKFVVSDISHIHVNREWSVIIHIHTYIHRERERERERSNVVS